MNRRQFLKSFGMTATAVAVAPVAVLKAQEFATGGIVSGNTEAAMLHTGESILPRKIADAMNDYYSVQWPVTGRKLEFGTPIIYGMTQSPLLAIWAANRTCKLMSKFGELFELCWQYKIPYSITTSGRFVVLEWPKGLPHKIKAKVESQLENQ